jgi:hypothetical protein
MNSYLLLRKILLTLVGGTLTLLGLIFTVLPGPSVLFLLPGLYLLSLEYEQAKVWLKKAQKMMTKTSRWIDKKIRQRKHSY